MKKPLLFVLIYACYAHTPKNDPTNLVRQKRSVLDLAVTLWCYRSRLKVPLLAINLYGCYCGTGGSGTPVDDVDRCCLLHDCCYRYSRLDLQCHSKIKWQFYHFSCGRSRTECKSSTLCGRMACECDRQFAECLTKAKPRKKHFFYNKKHLCVGPHESCLQVPTNFTSMLPWLQDPTSWTEVASVNWTDTAKSRKKRWRKNKNKTVKWKDPKGSPLWI
ncbi:phospholipase A2, minor isoenzyme-like [Gastrophryne carolinensis]